MMHSSGTAQEKDSSPTLTADLSSSKVLLGVLEKNIKVEAFYTLISYCCRIKKQFKRLEQY